VFVNGAEMKKLLVILIPCAIFARAFIISDMNLNSRSSGLRYSDFALSAQYSNNFSNPAFMAQQSLMYFSSTYYNHFEDINSGSITLVYPDIFKQGSSTAFSLTSIDYGNFSDIDTGLEYNPYDLMIAVSQGVVVKNILLGANLKYVYSSISSEYSSSAFIMDFAAIYKLLNGKLTAGAGIFDIGIQTDGYYNSAEEVDPHIRTGMSYKLDKLPLKLCGQYDYYLSGINRYATGLELDAKKNLIIRAGYDFSGQQKEIGSNSKIEKFGGISLGTTILFDAFGFDFSYIVNGELDEEFCATLNMRVMELLK